MLSLRLQRSTPALSALRIRECVNEDGELKQVTLNYEGRKECLGWCTVDNGKADGLIAYLRSAQGGVRSFGSATERG
jgi:hypothetical protein